MGKALKLEKSIFTILHVVVVVVVVVVFSFNSRNSRTGVAMRMKLGTHIEFGDL